MPEANIGHVTVSDDAPDFELHSLQDQTIKLSDYRGKKVVLFIWASW